MIIGGWVDDLLEGEKIKDLLGGGQWGPNLPSPIGRWGNLPQISHLPLGDDQNILDLPSPSIN